eukprot:gene12073-13317_t
MMLLIVALAACILPTEQSLHDIVFPPPFSEQNLGPDSEDPPGHLKPLGWQRPPEGPVKEYDRTIATQEYYDNHIKSKTPLVLRQAIKLSPAIEKWSDKYLKEKYGDLDVLVEKKQENRTYATGRMRYSEFIDRYQKDDLYVVTMLPKAMMHEVQAVNTVLCGTFKNFTHESNFWMSNGGTRSVIHYDADHNLHCMIAGRKDLIMVRNTPQNRKWLYMSKKPVTAGSGFSPLSPDRIDLKKYPNYAKVPWYHATIYPGDCVYIPAISIHQVRAYGRSLSVTTLFTEEIIHDKLKFSSEDCTDELLKEYHTMADIDFHWTYEKGDETIDMGYMNVERLRNMVIQGTRERTKRNAWNFKGFSEYFKDISYGEAQLSPKEVWLNVLNHTMKDIVKVEDVKEYTREQLKRLARSLDPPHGPKTDGLTKVSLTPVNSREDEEDSEGDEEDGGDDDKEDYDDSEEPGRPDMIYAEEEDRANEGEDDDGDRRSRDERSTDPASSRDEL